MQRSVNTCKFLRYIFAWEKISFDRCSKFYSFTVFDLLFDNCPLIVFVDRCLIVVLKLRGYGSNGFV